MHSFFDPAFFDPPFFGSRAIGEGTQQAWVTGKNNERIGYWVESGAIKGAVHAADDSALISEFTAVASGVDDTGIAVDESRGAGGEWRVVLMYQSGGSLKEAVSYDGTTFA